MPVRSGPAVPAGLALLALAAGSVAAGCVSNSSSGGGGATIEVESTATECRVSAAQAASGPVTFRVRNAGDEVTEFYLLADDGARVAGEVEDVGPGTTRDLVVQARPGAYLTACKPGMQGDGIRAPFTVTDSGASFGPESAAPADEDDDEEASEGS